MKQAMERIPNEWPEYNDIKLGDCLHVLRTHRGRTITLKPDDPTKQLTFYEDLLTMFEQYS